MEIWKDVPSLPRIQASSEGRLRRPLKAVKMPNGGTCLRHGKPTYGAIYKANKKASHSYMGVFYRDVGNVKVHRAVCEAFHGPPPFAKAVVIHINENSHDNRAANLKWGTQKENLNMSGFIAYCKARKGLNNPRIKARIRKETEILLLCGEKQSDA